MPDEIQELHENAEKAREHPSLVPATFTMSLVAVLLAAVSVLGHRAHTQTLLAQTKASDAWAQYQAKDIRLHNSQFFLDMLAAQPVSDAAAAEQFRAKYADEVQHYGEQLKGISGSAKAFEAQSESSEHRADRYDFAEVCLEAAVVMISITLITHNRLFWGMGCVMTAVGIGIAISSYWTH